VTGSLNENELGFECNELSNLYVTLYFIYMQASPKDRDKICPKLSRPNVPTLCTNFTYGLAHQKT